MTLKFSDYHGPTGLYVATGTAVLSLDSPAGAVAFVGGAVQSGIGDPGASAVVQCAVDGAMTAALAK